MKQRPGQSGLFMNDFDQNEARSQEGAKDDGSNSSQQAGTGEPVSKAKREV